MNIEQMNEKIAKLRSEIKYLEEEKNRMLIDSGEITYGSVIKCIISDGSFCEYEEVVYRVILIEKDDGYKYGLLEENRNILWENNLFNTIEDIKVRMKQDIYEWCIVTI